MPWDALNQIKLKNIKNEINLNSKYNTYKWIIIECSSPVPIKYTKNNHYYQSFIVGLNDDR